MSWAGEFIHLNCEIIRQDERKEKRKQEAADRHQVDLMKQALKDDHKQWAKIINQAQHTSEFTVVKHIK